jgi:methionine-rich copper-binding protein CopC
LRVPRQVQAPTERPRPRRRGSPVAAIGLLAAVLPAFLLLLASPASAHSRLEVTSPAADATLSSAPADVVLTFNESVSAQYSHVAVTRADGSSATSGATTVDGVTVRQPLAPLGNGRYTVAYRVVSTDGHPVGGTFVFTVAGATTAPAPSPTTTTAKPSAAGGTASSPASTATTDGSATASPANAATRADDDGGDGGGGWILVTVLVVLVVVAGGAVLVVVRRRHSGAH